MRYFLILILLCSQTIFAARIVSLSPSVTEILADIGAQAQIVGRDSASDTPASVKNIPIVGDYQQINIEKIVQLKPDVVLVAGVKAQQQQLDQLKKFNIPVTVINPTLLPDISATIMRLGEIADEVESAKLVAQQFTYNLAQLPHAEKPVTVFYQLWSQPLLTLNNSALAGQVVQRCGGVNIFADLPNNAESVALETVIARKPQLIIVTNAAAKQFWQQRKLDFHPQILQVSDAQSQRYTPAIIEFAQQVCLQIYKIGQQP